MVPRGVIGGNRGQKTGPKGSDGEACPVKNALECLCLHGIPFNYAKIPFKNVQKPLAVYADTRGHFFITGDF